MSKLSRLFLFLIGGLLLTTLVSAFSVWSWLSFHDEQLLAQLGPEAPVIKNGTAQLRDLNKNGAIDPYEDPLIATEERVEDLLNQMTIKEKVGLMLHHPMGVGNDGNFLTGFVGVNPPPSTPTAVIENHANHFNLFFTPNAQKLAEWHNRVQKLAERTRLGIPVTISSDPRHGNTNLAATFTTEGFSVWCEPVGFGAIGDKELVKKFGEIAAQEYRAVGIHVALHPQIDLSTDPRWARTIGTFGEDAHLTAELGAAYIKGFQGDELSSSSVSCMTKHFSGGGPQKDGWDPHFRYGQEQAYPGDNFDYHLIPFDSAFKAKTSQIMPYYGVPVGQTSEDVAFAFNKEIITDLLRNDYGFDGIVCTDWGVLEPFKFLGFELVDSKNYGVEDLDVPERIAKAIDAGIDQFGGHSDPRSILKALELGLITEERIDESARRLLREKFNLGLFDNPYVDLEAVSNLVGSNTSQAIANQSQQQSIVLLKNDPNGSVDNHLPLSKSVKIYTEDFDKNVVSEYATVVENINDSDYVLVKLSTPFEPRQGIQESILHQGSLAFSAEEKKRIINLSKKKPVIIAFYMERPAVFPEIANAASGILAYFGATEDKILNVIFGEFNPVGKLPFEIPSSLEAVENQFEDVPYDSKDPLFPFGHGLHYQIPL